MQDGKNSHSPKMANLSERSLVGYRIGAERSGQAELSGIANIAGEPVEHLLTLCANPRDACDVGRSEDGDLVWISTTARGPSETFEFSLFPERITHFEPERINPDVDFEHDVFEKRNLFSRYSPALSRRKSLVISSACAGVVFVIVGMWITSALPESTQTIAPQEISSTEFSSEQQQLVEPTDAAIEFVVTGQIPGLTIPEGTSRDSIQATVVSKSGEIVLVDVQARFEGGLTTFATLLLQKSGTAWRIREVFDPR